MNFQEYSAVEEIPDLKNLLPLFQYRNVKYLELREPDLIEKWLFILSRSIQQGVLNSTYPDPEGICCYLEAFRPKRNFFSVLGDEVLKIHWRSGIPILAEFTGIRERKDRADHELKKEEQSLDEESAFLHFLSRCKLAPLFDFEVVLKKTGNGKQTFDVSLNRFDPVSNKFVRYHVRLTQEISKEDRLVNLESVTNIGISPEFRKALSVYSWLESELVFYVLSTFKGVSVEMVSRSAVGPFYFGEYYYKNVGTAPELPLSVAKILSSHPKAVWLTLPQDSADILLKGTQDNDPFSLPLAQINSSAYSEVMRRNNDFGIIYGIRRNTVFVVSKEIYEKVKTFCKERKSQVQIFILEDA